MVYSLESIPLIDTRPPFEALVLPYLIPRVFLVEGEKPGGV